MNTISLYILLILIFLGLSKSFSPSEHKTPFIEDERYISSIFSGAPISVTLTESFQTGFLIKTYFQRYKVVHGFKHPEVIIVRASKRFWENNLKNKGMSLFRRNDREGTESIIPMPPGFLYLGNPAYGRWKQSNSGLKEWSFHRAYRSFPEAFHWGDFRPSLEFYKKGKIHLNHEKPFYGSNNEFGLEGEITIKNVKEKTITQTFEVLNFKDHIKKYIDLPSWSISNTEN
jgi:hypothetical protein